MELCVANPRSIAILPVLVTAVAVNATLVLGTAWGQVTEPNDSAATSLLEVDGLLMALLAVAAVAFQVRRAYRATWRGWHKIENDHDASAKNR